MENMNAFHVMALLPALIAEVSAGVTLQTVETAAWWVWKKADSGGGGGGKVLVLVGMEQEFCKQQLGTSSALTCLGSKIQVTFLKMLMSFYPACLPQGP